MYIIHLGSNSEVLNSQVLFLISSLQHAHAYFQCYSERHRVLHFGRFAQ